MTNGVRNWALRIPAAEHLRWHMQAERLIRVEPSNDCGYHADLCGIASTGKMAPVNGPLIGPQHHDCLIA